MRYSDPDVIDISKIRAVSIDLDDTLWPVWPTIERAERALQLWLAANAPQTAKLHESVDTRRAIRAQLDASRPDLRHDFTTLRLESIRIALVRAEEDPALAEAAFEVFFAERQRVDLYDDALPALEHLASRWPLVALSNGNADVHRVGIGRYFKAKVAAREVGFGKPDQRIFQAAARAAGVEARQVLHIGDDPALDALGALAAGMQSVWLNRTGQPWAHDPSPHLTVAGLNELRGKLEFVE
ncbi:MAG: HAD-IA family hydrolase [Burkholderiales bacterium]